MAEESKRERRESAREARRIAEQEAAAAAAKARVKSVGITLISLVLIGGLVWLAVDNVRTSSIDAAILIDRTAAESVLASAGCEVLATDEPNPGAAEHLDPATAPPADVMYPFDIRPAHSGPHFGATLPIIRAGASNQLEERGLVHNLEHGAIYVAYNPDLVDGSAVNEMESVAETLNDNGFALSAAGAGIFVSPYTEPGITSGKAVAFRAWGQAVDCDTFSEDALLHFTREHYGTEGVAPEGNFAPYRFDILAYEDEAANATDGPTEPIDLGTMIPSEDPTASESASTSESTSPSESETVAPGDEPTATESPTAPSETPSES